MVRRENNGCVAVIVVTYTHPPAKLIVWKVIPHGNIHEVNALKCRTQSKHSVIILYIASLCISMIFGYYDYVPHNDRLV